MILVYENSFGEAVRQRLSKTVELQAIRFTEAIYNFDFDDGAFVAIVTGRPYPKKHLKLAKKLTEAGIVFTSIGIHDKFLQFGPVVMPNIAPCYECTDKRNLSLLEYPRTSDFERVIRQAFDTYDDLEIEGFLSTHVSMAICKILEHEERPKDFVGKLSMISFVDSRTLESEVIPVHACPTCSDAKSDDYRQVSNLQVILEEIL